MARSDLLFPPGATRHDWVLDGALVLGMALATSSPYLMFGTTPEGHRLQLFGASLAMVLPLVLRRHSPLLMLAGTTLAGLVQLWLFAYPLASLVVIPIVAYSMARWVPGSTARWVIVVGFVAAILGPARWLFSEAVVGLNLRVAASYVVAVLVCLGLVVTPYAIGRRARESSEAELHRVEAAEERYHQLITEREQQARLAEAQVRANLAREMHDIVAHSVSVMIVQAEGGRAAAAKRPEAALEALDTIAETGREALQEIRRIVGVLRRGPGEPEADFAPAPGLDDLADLVQRASDRVAFRTLGEAPRVPAALALTVYRVVQEALTNFLKHAGPEARAAVTVAYHPTGILVDVTDNGHGRQAAADGTGHGLRGMQERVASMGGTMMVKAPEAGGFQVQVQLPVPTRG